MLIISGFLLACLLLAAVIAIRNYRASRWLVEAAPQSPLLTHPNNVNLDNLQTIRFESRGSHLVGWYVPANNRAAVVIAHGSHSDRTGMLAEMRLLAAAGFGVLAFDWPGLGESEGSIRWGAEARDALSAAVDWLAARPDVDPRRIGGLGFSIGGFVMTQVAAKDQRLRALVIESPASEFNAYVRIHFAKWGVLSEWPARWALRDSGLLVADNSALRVIGEISPRPILLIGGTDDTLVPVTMLQTLDEAARPPKQLWIIKGAQHGGYAAAAGAEYAGRLRAFFEANLVDPATGAQ